MPSGKTNAPRSPRLYGQKRDDEREDKFIEGLREGMSPRAAAATAGIARATAFNWKADDLAAAKDNPALEKSERFFPRRWREASEEGYDKLEDEARRRAEVGWDVPVFQKGERVGEVRTYSDSLMTILLKGRRPEVYNTDRVEVTGKDGGPVTFDFIRRTIVDPKRS